VSCVEEKKKCCVALCVWSSSRNVCGEEREGLWEREKRKGRVSKSGSVKA
jgi:hypothetical protein